MTKREAKIKALELLGSYSLIIINSLSMKTYEYEDIQKIANELDNICDNLQLRAKRLKDNK